MKAQGHHAVLGLDLDLGTVDTDVFLESHLDLFLHTEAFQRRVDLSVGVRNLLDTDAREPAPPAIPNDFPLEGRSAVLKMRVKF